MQAPGLLFGGSRLCRGLAARGQAARGGQAGARQDHPFFPENSGRALAPDRFTRHSVRNGYGRSDQAGARLVPRSDRQAIRSSRPDIPEHLLAAHEEGREVFFCGAGISFPAGLGDFNWLTCRLFRRLGVRPTPAQASAIREKRFDQAIHGWKNSFERAGLTPGLRLQLLDLLQPRIELRTPHDYEVEWGLTCPDLRLVPEVSLCSGEKTKVFSELSAQPAWQQALPELFPDFNRLLREAVELIAELWQDPMADRSHLYRPSLLDTDITTSPGPS